MNIQKNIKNIIFDLGGVILNIDYHLTSKAFKELGIKDFDAIYSQAAQNNVFNNFETGALTSTEFRDYLKQFIPTKTDSEINKAWNSMLLDLPKERIMVLNAIKSNYRIFLLSNTNSIHVDAFTTYVDTTFGPQLFEQLFEKHYFSNEIGFRKPNANAFMHVLNENGLLADRKSVV